MGVSAAEATDLVMFMVDDMVFYHDLDLGPDTVTTLRSSLSFA